MSRVAARRPPDPLARLPRRLARVPASPHSKALQAGPQTVPGGPVPADPATALVLADGPNEADAAVPSYLAVRSAPLRWSTDPVADADELADLTGELMETLDDLQPSRLAIGRQWARDNYGADLDDDEAGEIATAGDWGCCLAAAERFLAESRAAETGAIARRRAAAIANAAYDEARAARAAARAEAKAAAAPRPAAPPPLAAPIRPHRRVVSSGPSAETIAALAEAWALVGAFGDDPEAWIILRRAALDAGDHDIATMARARARAVRAS